MKLNKKLEYLYRNFHFSEIFFNLQISYHIAYLCNIKKNHHDINYKFSKIKNKNNMKIIINYNKYM